MQTREARWDWDTASPAHANYGNANQWTVNAGLHSLARETTQNSNDAKIDGNDAELVFTLTRLSGDAKNKFLEALDWKNLRSHLAAMSEAADAAVAAAQIGAGLSALEQSDALLLLNVADYGCKGLTGAELLDDVDDEDEYGNFIRLCRLDLFSGKGKAAGGSFGLGKAVYWRFSRLQTVLFHSVPEDHGGDSRLFGVNQGVVHRLHGTRFEGRGFFGVPMHHSQHTDVIGSMWGAREAAEALHLGRDDSRSGTSALLVGFYDPDSPEQTAETEEDLLALSDALMEGVEANFWPLLARGKLSVRVRVFDGNELLRDQPADPAGTFNELVSALRKFDAGDIQESLEEAGDVVVRDIPIQVPARIDKDAHPAFTEQAKLVVTLSDENPDSLENTVCFLRRAGMVVERVDQQFEGRKYHAFLLAGAAIDPDNPTDLQLRADDFLRFAEPPAHDRWTPGSGSKQVSQSNLQGRYKAPWRPQLTSIRDSVVKSLFDLFDAPLPSGKAEVKSILRHLSFLKGPGQGGGGGRAPRKPMISLTSAHIEMGKWVVTFEIQAPNRTAGWRVVPELRFAGLQGGEAVAWRGALKVLSGGTSDGDAVVLEHQERKRKVTAVVQGTSTDDLPIPAEEAGVTVSVARSTVAPPKVRADDALTEGTPA